MLTVGALLLGFALGALSIYFLFSRRQLTSKAAPLPPPNADLNKDYNELISEVAVLIQQSVAKANIDRELEAARALHKAILPVAQAEYQTLSVAGRCFPAGSCGGDWWFHRQVGDDLIVWLGDVAGHGIGSALIASACVAVADAATLSTPGLSVANALALMNSVIGNVTKNELHVTAVCLRLNTKTGVGTIASASHTEVMLLTQARGTGELLEHPTNYPLAVGQREAFLTRPITLEPGQSLFLMTDGLLEFPQSNTRTWSHKRLLAFVTKEHASTTRATDLVEAVERMIFANGTGELPDDITFATVTRAAVKDRQNAA